MISVFNSLLLLFLLTLVSLPSVSFCDDCPFPCLPPPPPPITSSPPPAPPTPVYNSPPPPYIPTPSYWNYPPPPYTPGSVPFNQPPGSNVFGAPPPPNPILPYFPWYYNSPNSGSATLIPVSLVICLSLFGLVVPEFLFF